MIAISTPPTGIGAQIVGLISRYQAPPPPPPNPVSPSALLPEVIGNSVDNIATAFGLSAAEIAAQINAGMSLDDILVLNGIDPELGVDALLLDAAAAIDQAVIDGLIDQDTADANLERLRSTIEGLLGSSTILRSVVQDSPEPIVYSSSGDLPDTDLLEGIANYLGIEAEALIAYTEQGFTIAEGITQENGEVWQVVEGLLNPSRQQLDAAVEQGRLSNEQASAMLQRMREALQQFIFNVS